MPVIEVDQSGRLHVAWYDTRDHLRNDGQSVRIGLYYAYSDDHGNTFTSIKLDDEVIDTQYLSNKKFIGDNMDITMTPNGNSAVIVFMGTTHPLYQEGGAGEGDGFGEEGFGPPIGSQENEAIFSWRIDQ